MKNLITKLKRIARIVRATGIRKVIHLTRKIHLPGFEGISLWEILFFFVWSIRRGLITTRAASLSFHFFLALIPFGLILVTVTAILPYFDLEQDIEPILEVIIPKTVLANMFDNLEAYHSSTVSSWLSVGFVTALYFTSNGFSVLIKTFNRSVTKFSKRKWWSIKLMSFAFVLGFIAGIFALFFIMVYSQRLINFTGEHIKFVSEHISGISSFATFIILSATIYFGVACLFYFGPSDRKHFRFFSAGATLATFLIIAISFGYSYYVTNYAKYNDMYGSLGTLMIILLWIYLMSLVLLIGFELNASISGAILKKKLKNLGEIEDQYVKDFH